MTPSVHLATVVGWPFNKIASRDSLLAPNPFPNSTSFVPTGPLIGSMRMDGNTFSGRALLTLYSTGAQHDPSGKGSDDASRTMTSPDAALPGTSTSSLSSRHFLTRAGTPLMSTSLT